MGIPGLGKAIGNADRIALSRLAVHHLEIARRPLRVAVDISIWLFQLQAGRGGQNPELRTLFFRLVRLLALPVHPLFVYDGRQKPPFKRGKATTGRSYGSAPIISLSKILIDLFKFPRHDAPGEAEAECARLQQAGVVDAVMSNDIDTLMFGSGFTVMNFSKEGSTGTTAATHVDCYTTETRLDVEANVKLSRPGMVLFAMLSGGDYLPSGITKCGPGLAGEIAKAGFGEDLFEIIDSNEGDLELKLAEWRERLQYELDENESGYFQCKHKAVRIPDTFPDRQILSFYAKPIVSNEKDIEKLRQRLVGAWDHEIDALELRKFVANYFDWKYRSGARKLIRSLAEPVLLTRLRLAQSPVAPFGYGSYTPNTDLPVLQRIYRSRMHFSTGCVPQVQLEMVPIDIVGLDLDAEEPNPPLDWSQATESNIQPADDADVDGIGAEANTTADAGPNTSKINFARHPYNPFEPEKIWVFETVANLGIPDVLARWKQQEAEKKMPKKPVSKRTTTKTKKKKVIDPTMKPGGILRYTTVTKPGGDMNSAKKSQILDAVGLSSSPQIPSSQTTYNSQYSAWSDTGDTSNAVFPNQFQHSLQLKKSAAASMDKLTGHFATSCMIGDERVGSAGDSYFRCPPRRTLDWDHIETDIIAESIATISPSPTRFKLSYTATSSLSPIRTENVRQVDLLPCTGSPTPKSRRSKDFRSQQSLEVSFESLNLSPISQQSAAAMTPGKEKLRKLKLDAGTRSRRMEDIQAVEASADLEMDRCETRIHSSRKAINRNKQTEEIQDITPNTRLKAASEIEIREDEVRDHHQSQHLRSNTVTETIRTSKGFWTVEVHEEQKSKSICSDNETTHEKSSIKQSSKKERIARVSVVDMR